MNMISKLRPNQYSKTLIVLLVIVETLAIVFSYQFIFWFWQDILDYSQPAYKSYTLAWLLLWVTVSLLTNAYTVENHRRIKKIFAYTFKLALIHLPLSAAVAIIMGLDQLSFTFLADLYLLFIIFSIGIKSIALLYYRYICNLEKNKQRVVIVGYTPAGMSLHKYFTDGKSSGYHFAGFFDNNISSPLVVGNLKQLKNYCTREKINEIFYALPYDDKLIQDISSFADENFIRFGVLQDIGGVKVKSLHSDIYGNDLPVLSIKTETEGKESLKSGYLKAISVLRSLNL
ncbi:FlaA1/EpsC-like NDP-sugar epimerase [Catalinimonas alkaloidigena]|uniref:nucleoside-diphosphate sugar epimerase/dehydratase n=1 Tax=Catalinimonas alkaloidigena TaxID=1075417 RepID=UPI00240563A3|nr:hypothetical protein [Catalinimonas alkaloidigena]MDF9796789.1 FlaA1/EpsC-like NDP-sugar epimerase [Catalinimonas alkaloidigena]